MRITNPFIDNAPTDLEDRALVARARSGESQGARRPSPAASSVDLQRRRSHANHPQDAEDATQEILIKVLTRLSSVEGRSSFRTWLYRIVVNHVLNMKRGRAEVQHASIDFASYGAALDATPDLELADPKGTSADTDCS